MKFNGLSEKEVQISREKSGTNALTQKEQESLLQKLLEGFKDPMLMILIAALVIQIIFVVLGKADWFEAVGIFIAICVANFVGVLSENKQEGKAQELKAEEMAKEKVKVHRDGKLIEIGINDVVVGDIVVLQAGDKIPADGIIVEGSIKVDQASLNGESAEATKTVLGDNDLGNIKDLLNPYYVYRGTVVTNSECLMRVEVVGDKTIYGELALEMQDDTRDTPLKIKLAKLAGQISKFGYIGASVIAGAYLIQTFVLDTAFEFTALNVFQAIIQAISLAVVIVVMAVPEGLPMMIALVLSMNMGKMMKDNVLVRKLNGIETAGGLNILFSDKTGTITEGKLSVVEMATGGVHKFTDLSKVSVEYAAGIVTGIGLNNSASYSDGAVIGGNSTDRALMQFLTKGNTNHMSKADRDAVKEFNPFDSAKKYSSIVVITEEGTKQYIKGAPEKIIDKCTKYIDENGKVKELKERNTLLAYMNEQAGRSMRLLAVAEGNDDADLTLVCVISIRDNVRKEAVSAIKEVQNAGVQVVMVTGDRKETAIAIAKEAGLLAENTDIALTSDELNELTDDEVKEKLPNLRVVARALPTDKSRLVRLAQELDLVVGMTGDGVNDAPALKKADVGFAMGSGTDVAKEAGDITILDDNFSSIEKAILYGRTIFKSIRKFIIFQLTVNVGAVLLCFIAPFLGISQPISIVSLLYINLVMDTLAALAFGGEPSLQRFMSEKPINRQDSIVNKTMMSQILSTGAYIVAGSLFVLLSESFYNVYANGSSLSFVDAVSYRETAMLIFFMLTVILNGFYARSENFNVFEDIGENKQFIWVMLAVVFMLVILVYVVGVVAGLSAVQPITWLVMFGLSLGSVVVDMIRKAIVRK